MRRQREGLENNFWLRKSFGLKERRGGGGKVGEIYGHKRRTESHVPERKKGRALNEVFKRSA